ncbi:MAG: metabolite traffic protein EboE [Planctomycetota bacterium]
MSRGYTPLLGYSTNVHRGETLAQVYRFLKDYTIPIRERVFGGDSCGLELRLGIGSAKELGTAKARREFKSYLDDGGLELFSVNAFPLLDFHAKRVKEKVYKPSWAEADRGRWTSRIAKIVAELVPEGVEASISTLGGMYRREAHDHKSHQKFARVALNCLETFVELGQNGRPMVLAFEPEPETSFETSRDVIEFFDTHLLPMALERWRHMGSKSKIEDLLRQHFSVNVDTCHFSVLFEDQIDNLSALEKAGIRLGKLHVTNAVALENPYRSPGGYEDLRRMHEPRYFHQFCGTDKNGEVAWRGLDLDLLPKTLDRKKHPDVAELRSHFHVPVYLKRYNRLKTTLDDTERALRYVVRRKQTEHLVLETYTWPILTGDRSVAGRAEARAKLIRGITKEFRWLRGVLGK